jgi:hypothetical protein
MRRAYGRLLSVVFWDNRSSVVTYTVPVSGGKWQCSQPTKIHQGMRSQLYLHDTHVRLSLLMCASYNHVRTITEPQPCSRHCRPTLIRLTEASANTTFATAELK